MFRSQDVRIFRVNVINKLNEPGYEISVLIVSESNKGPGICHRFR